MRKAKLGWAAASAAVMLLAACGGGGSGGGAPAAAAAGGGAGAGVPGTSTLVVSGVAATGAALANADVRMKCATGNGTAITSASGTYAINVPGGTLPCMLEVSGTQGGVTVLLHSIVRAGTPDQAGEKTSATAHMTPITEMVVAQLLGALPADSFATYKAETIYSIHLSDATHAVVDALRSAGVDLGTEDPIKGDLVAATGGGHGSAYDQALDVLGARLGPEALDMVVNHIALAAASHSRTGLQQAASAVSGGSLPGCPAALSGKYRSLEDFGEMALHQVDFTTMKFQASNGVDRLDIAADPAKPCEWTATGTEQGARAEWNVVFGPTGVGVFRWHLLDIPSSAHIGYLFPVQPHSFGALKGTWTFLQSGRSSVLAPGALFPEENLIHAVRQMSFRGEPNGPVCLYDPLTWACSAATPFSAFSAHDDLSDGHIEVDGLPGIVGNVDLYGYRGPRRSLLLFGTRSRSGSSDSTSFVATLQTPQQAPAVGSVQKIWEASLEASASIVKVQAPATDAYRILISNNTSQLVRRQRESDGREEVVRVNQPIDGIRQRDALVFNGVRVAPVFQLPLADSGLVVTVNSVPAGVTGPYSFGIGVVLP